MGITARKSWKLRHSRTGVRYEGKIILDAIFLEDTALKHLGLPRGEQQACTLSHARTWGISNKIDFSLDSFSKIIE